MTTIEKRSTTTILVENISSPMVKCTARETFTVGGVTVKAGEQFFLVQSSSDTNRYYVVAFIAHTWTCSCGAGAKTHAHNKVVKAWIIEHVVKPKQVAIQAKKDIGTQGNLNGNRGFTMLKGAA